MAVGRIDSNELLQLQILAVDAAANAIVITDRDGMIVWVNRAFTRLTGFTAAEAVGHTPGILKSGEQEPGVYRELWATIRAGHGWRGRLVNRRKDGSVYTEEETMTPVTDDDGVVTHFIAVKQDVTELREVSERLRARDDLFRLLLENALDIITILDVGRDDPLREPVRPADPGLRAARARGPERVRVHARRGRPRAIAVLGRLHATSGGTATLEFRFRHKDGSWRTSRPSARTCSTTRCSPACSSTPATSPSVAGSRTSWPISGRPASRAKSSRTWARSSPVSRTS